MKKYRTVNFKKKCLEFNGLTYVVKFINILDTLLTIYSISVNNNKFVE